MIFLNNYNPVDSFDLEATLLINLWAREGKEATLKALRWIDHPQGLELLAELIKRSVKMLNKRKA